jgi:hypothetical protein
MSGVVPFAFAQGDKWRDQMPVCNNMHTNYLHIHTNSLVRFDNPDNFT